MYYDTLCRKAVDEQTLKLRGLEQASPDMLRSLGIYPLVHADTSGCNPYTQYFTTRYVPLGDCYLSQPEIHDITNQDALAALLLEFKAQRRAAFMLAFEALDMRAQRPQAAVLGAMLAGDSPPAADADLLWQVQAVKEENRRLLAQLDAAHTWDEAQELRPWLPWQSQLSRSLEHFNFQIIHNLPLHTTPTPALNSANKLRLRLHGGRLFSQSLEQFQSEIALRLNQHREVRTCV